MKEVNLSTCADEPIHIPGSIQDYGCLLATTKDFRVAYYSLNISRIFKDKVIQGYPVENIIGADIVHDLQSFTPFETQQEKYYLHEVKIEGKEYPCLIHSTEKLYVFEIGFKTLNHQEHSKILESINRVLAVIAESSSLDYLLNKITIELKRFLRIDRVMIYKFDEKWNGEVIAEAKEDHLEPYLGLHFPDTDIPEQARALYTKNWLRTIPDVDYTASPINPQCGPDTENPLDLSDSVLRSISPIHIQYLKNMGVQATVVMSLIVNDKLWGLVACHHYSPHFIPMEVRYLSEMFAKLFSSSISKLSIIEQKNHISGKQDVLNKTNIQIYKEWSVNKSLFGSKVSILDLVDCEGAVLYTHGALDKIGEVPKDSFIKQLVHKLEVHLTDEIFSTYTAKDDFPELKIPREAAGILALDLGKRSETYLILFRKERLHHVNWAGDPDKKVLVNTDTMQLSPRRSFGLFKQAVHWQSKKWMPYEMELLRVLKRYILEFYIFEKIRLELLVAEKTQKLSDTLKTVEHAKLQAERNEALKSHMLQSISHEIRTPLNGILGIAHVLLNRIDNEELKKLIDMIKESGDRLMNTLTSVLDLAEVEANKKLIHFEEFEIVGLIESCVKNLETVAESKSIKISVKAEQRIKCFTDDKIINQIFHNIISNAIKYTKEGEIIIVVEEKKNGAGGAAVIKVIDSGEGISKDYLKEIFSPFTQESTGLNRNYEGLGLGLSITKKYIDLLGGTISVFSAKGLGSTFEINLPLKVNDVV